MTFGVYLTTRWLPGKRLVLADSTYDGYRRKVERHVLPALGSIALRRLRPDHLEALYERLLHPTDGSAGSRPQDRVRGAPRHPRRPRRRRPTRTRLPQRRPRRPRTPAALDPKVEQQAWTADELQAFLRAAAGHRLFPAFWVAAFTGMRRNELLGLRWDDFDPTAATAVRSTAA